MLKGVVYSVSNLFALICYIRLVSSHLPLHQVSVMTRVYEIFQNDTTASSFVWQNVEKNSNPCSWKGISCSSDNSSINQLSFSQFSISTSEFLPFLCSITSLESLDVSNNHLTSIPQQFYTNCGKISGLKLLTFRMNLLKGPLPTFNGFRMLEFLDYSHNLLIGEIMLELDGLGSLKSLDLSWNRFGGTVPTNLGKMNLLEELRLSGNNFAGEIPVEIIKYRNLSEIDLSGNALSGSIPQEIGELTRLESLVLSNNRLRGRIPTSLSNITTLKRFAANLNNLSGSIPSGITSYLETLGLSYNELTGTIPSNLLFGPNLQFLDMSYNDLQGPIPASNSTKLFRLRLGSNSLNGSIPSESLESLGGLLFLELDNNRLSGEIPLGLGRCRNLVLLNLAQNNLTGLLPPLLGDLTKLQVLNLQTNNFIGEIPPQVSWSKWLERLNIGNNSLTGSIPFTLSKLMRLEVLDLSNNKLSGRIPNFLTQLDGLTELLLSNNKLSGVVPLFRYRVELDIKGNANLNVHGNYLSPLPPQRKSEPRSIDSDFVIAFASGIPIGMFITFVLSILRKYNRIHCNLSTPSSSIYRSNIDFKKAMEAVADSSNIILKTSFSTYYKAIMPSGTTYLVKKVTRRNNKVFQLHNHEKLGKKLQDLGKLSNSNIMIPVAYILTMHNAYFLYDSAAKCTLSYILHRRTGDPLDWASRYSIAIGVSQGLAFLHECNSGPIILLHLSSESILLKSPNEPQIGDIELCKLSYPQKNRGSSFSTIADYDETKRVTATGNVFSFGVVLLELVTGKEAVSEGSQLAEWVLTTSQLHQHQWEHILDANVSTTSVAVRSQMLMVLEVALACVSASPETRPNMVTVLQMLNAPPPHGT